MIPRSKHLWGIVGATVAGGFLTIFVILPLFRPFFRTPHYGVACLTPLTYRSGNTPLTFDNIPLDAVVVENGVAKYKNPDSDVVAKLICAQGHVPEEDEHEQFYEDAVHSPYYSAISSGPVNYGLYLIH